MSNHILDLYLDTFGGDNPEAARFVVDPPTDFDHGAPFRPGESIAAGARRLRAEHGRPGWHAEYHPNGRRRR